MPENILPIDFLNETNALNERYEYADENLNKIFHDEASGKDFTLSEKCYSKILEETKKLRIEEDA